MNSKRAEKKKKNKRKKYHNQVLYLLDVKVLSKQTTTINKNFTFQEDKSKTNLQRTK